MNEERKIRNRAIAAAWDAANPEKCRERKRKWTAANREKCQASVRKWRAANPEKCRAYVRKHRAATVSVPSLLLVP